MTTTATSVLRSHVCGDWFSGEGEGIPLFNPTTGTEIARCSTLGLDYVAALDYARQTGGPRLRAMSFADRGAMLQAMAESLHAHREELLDLSGISGGNTRGDAKFDVDGAIGTLSYYARLGGKMGDGRFLVDEEATKLSRSPRFVGRHVMLPLTGVAIHINAFNFPAWGLAEKAACALLAGMPVLSKPATSTSILAERMVAIWVGDKVMPAGALSLVCGGAGDMLDHVTGQDVIAFTGSADTAARIRSGQAVRENSTRLNVEADSLNAAVIGEDLEPGSVTWNLFIQEVAKDMTQKAGQKCTAIRRVFVPTEYLDAAKQELSEELDGIGVGDPSTKDVRMGPLASIAQLEDTQDGIRALLECCEIVRGEIGSGELVSGDFEDGCFQTSVLLSLKDGTNGQLIHQREVFGPVATLIPYQGGAEVVAELVRLGRGSLVTSVYSDNRKFVEEMMFAIAPFNGRINFASAKVAEHSMGPGTVLPSLIHGGPGRAGGGEELGGKRGLRLYLQRTALQGDEPMLSRMLTDALVSSLD